MIQNENHLYYQNNELQEYVKPYGIVIESWYPFGGRGHTGEHFGNETIIRIAEAHKQNTGPSDSPLAAAGRIHCNPRFLQP